MRPAVSVLLFAAVSTVLVSTVLVACGSPEQAGPTTAPAVTSEPLPATSPATLPATPALPLAGRMVVVDPGHNGGNAANPRVVNALVPAGRGRTKPCNTTGTESDAGYPEHAFAWDVALRVRDLLVERGATVTLTRQDDTGVGPCVDQRAAAGNGPDVDAVVSVHADGSSPGASGFHVAYSDPPLNPAQAGPAVALATAVRDAMGAADFPTADYIGSAGLHGRDDLAGLNLAERPAVLVECANLRNPAEAAAAASPEGRARYASAIADGITGFLLR